jgi:hypothetical protein
MPTAIETAIEIESVRPDPGVGLSLADPATLRAPEGERAAESTGPAPPFEAGAADAFGSGWPTPGEEVRRWS